MPRALTLPTALLCALLLAGCRRSPGPQPTPATSAPTSTPATPALLRVHACVRIDGAPAPHAAVATGLDMASATAIPLDADACFTLARPPGELRGLIATAPGRGRVVQTLLPISGDLELELDLPPADTTTAATLRSDDLASRLTGLAAWYRSDLRGQPSAAHLEQLAARHDAEPEPTLRAALGILHLVLARTPGAPIDTIDPARLRDALAAVDPTHIAWSIEMEAIVLAADDLGPAYLERVLAEHPDPQVYGAAAHALASTRTAAGDLDGVRQALTTLRARGGSSVFAKIALTLEPGDALAQGQPLPPFRLHRADRPGLVDSTDLRGKVLVLHFWATWCQPCLTQLPLLADLHARHAADGLEIVSLATDEAAQTVADYRRDHPMPWIHAWEPPEVAETLRRTYQVTDSSKTILVDRQGRVVAEDLAPKDPEFTRQLAAALARP